AGSAWRTASAATRSRRELKNAWLPMKSATAPRWANVAKAPSMSRSLAASTTMSFLSARVRRGGLDVSQLYLAVGEVRVHEHRNRARLGHKLAQQLKPLRN